MKRLIKRFIEWLLKSQVAKEAVAQAVYRLVLKGLRNAAGLTTNTVRSVYVSIDLPIEDYVKTTENELDDAAVQGAKKAFEIYAKSKDIPLPNLDVDKLGGVA